MSTALTGTDAPRAHVMHVGFISEILGRVDLTAVDSTLLLHERAVELLTEEARLGFVAVEAVAAPHRLNNNDYDDHYRLFLEAAERVAERVGRPTSVVALYEHSLLPAARLREHFGLPGMSVKTALACRDKVRMKALVSAAGVAVPACTDLAGLTSEGLTRWLGAVTGPWVLKPRSEGGSVGVRILTSGEELLAAVEALGDESDRYQVEEFIDGDIYHFDAVVRGGTMRFWMLSRYRGTCLSCSIDRTPLASISVHDPQLCRGAFEIAEQVVAAVGIVDSVIHLELFRRDETWVFLEVGARYGGGPIVDNVSRIYGVDLCREQYLAGIGVPSAAPDGPARPLGGHGASAWLLIPMAGRGEFLVRSVTIPADVDGVVGSWAPEPGSTVSDRFRPFPSIAIIHVVGPDEDTVVDQLNRITAEFDVELTRSHSSPHRTFPGME